MATPRPTMTVAEAGRLGGRQSSAAKRAATRESLKAARAAKAEKAATRKAEQKADDEYFRSGARYPGQ